MFLVCIANIFKLGVKRIFAFYFDGVWCNMTRKYFWCSNCGCIQSLVGPLSAAGLKLFA